MVEAPHSLVSVVVNDAKSRFGTQLTDPSLRLIGLFSALMWHVLLLKSDAWQFLLAQHSAQHSSLVLTVLMVAMSLPT